MRRWQKSHPQVGGAMPNSMGYPPVCGWPPHIDPSNGQYSPWAAPPHPQAHPYAPPVPPPHPGHFSSIGVLQQQAAGLSTSSTAVGRFSNPMFDALHGVPASGPPMAVSPAASTAAAPHWEAELTSRLSRLEGALSSLKPQIEVLLGQPQRLRHSHESQPMLQIPSFNFAGSSSDAAVQPSPSAGSPTSATSATKANSLANRRGAGGLAIQTTPATEASDKTKSAANVAKPLTINTSPPTKPQLPANALRSPTNGVQDEPQSRDASPNNDSKADLVADPRRPAVNINPCRVAPGIQDPQSPRSPGRYSAWK